MLLKSLVIIGAILGLLLGIVATCVPWLFPKIFTHDQNVIQEVSSYFLSLSLVSSIGSFIAFGVMSLSALQDCIKWNLTIAFILNFIFL
jgi:Na+-driven multidrug efflux pump